MSNATASVWYGWHRPDQRSPWQAIVTGADETETFNKLLSAIAGGDKCVLPRGVDPNDKPATMRRREF